MVPELPPVAGGSSGGPSSGAPVLSLVGDTPLIPLAFADLGLTVFAKCEFLNPSRSIKDRY